MDLTEKSLAIYKKIDFYKRYEALSISNQFDETFEKYSVDDVKIIIEELGYKAKFIQNGSFFKITEKQENIEFYFHLCLKYGLVELIIGGEDSHTKEPISGGSFSNICKDIRIAEKLEEHHGIKKPSFTNYDDLKKIFKLSFSLYEDFKKEIINSKSNKI